MQTGNIACLCTNYTIIYIKTRTALYRNVRSEAIVQRCRSVIVHPLSSRYRRHPPQLSRVEGSMLSSSRRWRPAHCLLRTLSLPGLPLAPSGISGAPPRLASTTVLSAVMASMARSSAPLNQRGKSTQRKGISAMISTGKPIAAMVCEMATHAATPRICQPMYRQIFRRRTPRSGSLRAIKRFSEKRKTSLCVMPLPSIEPHCARHVNRYIEVNGAARDSPRQQRIRRRTSHVVSCVGQ